MPTIRPTTIATQSTNCTRRATSLSNHSQKHNLAQREAGSTNLRAELEAVISETADA